MRVPDAAVSRAPQMFAYSPAMGPARILVMRHAEEPRDPKNPDLSEAGRRRADHLATYIPSRFGTPDFLISAAANKLSARALLTLRPLSHTIEAPIDTSFKSRRSVPLTRELMSGTAYKRSLVVICWTHLELPALADALGAQPRDCPDPWPEEVFNLILQLDYDKRHRLRVAKIVQAF
jgi:hypothetical protein